MRAIVVAHVGSECVEVWGCAVQDYMVSYFTYSGGHSTLVTSYLVGAGTTDSVNLSLNLATDTFYLKAVNGCRTGPPAEVELPLENVPVAPAIVATAYSRHVTLSWADYPHSDKAHAIGPIAGYAVYEGTSAGKGGDEAARPRSIQRADHDGRRRGRCPGDRYRARQRHDLLLRGS